MKVSNFAVKHPVVICMLLVVLVVFGLVSIKGMNVAFISDISMPSVVVISIYPGASAEDVEEDLTNVLENDFVTLPNFKNITSVSQNSFSLITITFQDDSDPYEQLPEVRNRINMKIKDLPSGLSGTPNALVGGATMLPIVTFSISGGQDTVRLTEYVENILKPRLTGIDGVATVSIDGGHNLRANIKLNLNELASKGISVTQLYQILNYSNINLPLGSGTFNQRTIDIRYSGGFSSIDDIKNIPIGSTNNGSVIIRLSDVADVYLDIPDPTSYITDGENSIIIGEVTKRSDGNTIEITKKIKNVLKDIEKETVGAVTCRIISDDSRTIYASLKTVIMSGIAGVIMAIIVLFIFLNDFRATFIIGISIPLSILFTFIGMKILGVTINLMSLSGMVVALGMIVDGSIVMIEQVYRYYHPNHENKQIRLSVKESIFRGSSEVGSSIFASTATTVVVFLPITTITGIVGMVLKDVVWTLILALTASFLVAVIVIPFLMNILFKDNVVTVQKSTFFTRFIDGFEKVYKKALRWALKSWKFIIVLSLFILIITIFAVTALGLSFIPSTDNGDFYIDLDFPNGQTLEQTKNAMNTAEQIIRKNVPEIDNAVFYIGQNQSTITGGTAANTGYVHIVLVPVADRKRGVHDIYLELQEILSAQIPDVTVKTSNGGFDKLLGYVSSGGGYGLTLAGDNISELYQTALRLESYLKNDIDVVSTSIDTSFDTNALIIDMSNDYMNSLGISSYEAGLTSAILFQGVDVGKFRNISDNSLYDIRLFSDITNSNISSDILSNININTLTGDIISFAGISDLRVEQSVSRINHTNRSKTVTVSATLAGEDTIGVSSRMEKYLEDNPLPQGISSQLGGITELIGDSIAPLISALLIAFFLVYTVMVLQFEKFRQPLLVMATIPFCIIGVVFGLLIFGSTMSLLAFLGVIALGGVVVNNGIILIDYINLIRKDEQDVEETEASLIEKIIVGSASRIRPVFMTTLTTMLGVVPMAVANGEGAEIYAPLGQAIAGGLLTSTMITLFIIPVLYYITEVKIKIRKKNFFSVLIILLSISIMPNGSQKLIAQETSEVLTLAKILSSARINNDEIQIAEYERDQSKYSVIEARSYALPTIDASIAGQYEYMPQTIESLVPGFIDNFNSLIDGVNKIGSGVAGLSKAMSVLHPGVVQPGSWSTIPNYSASAPSHFGALFSTSITQPIFTWGKILNSIALAKTGVNAKELQLMIKKREIETQVLVNTVAVFYLTKILESIENQNEYIDKLQKIATDSLNNGMILDEDLNNIKIKEAEVDTVRKSIQYQVKSIELTLSQLTKIIDISSSSIDFSFIPSDLSTFINTRTDVEGAVEYISTVSNESQLLNMRIDASRYKSKMASSETWGKPDIALKLGYSFSTRSFTNDFFNQGTWNLTAAIAINSTLFDGLKSYAIQKSSKLDTSIAVTQLQKDLSTLEIELRKLDESIKYKMLLENYYNEKIKNTSQFVDLSEREMNSGYGTQQKWLQDKITIESLIIEKLRNQISLFTDFTSYQYLCGLFPEDYIAE